MAHRRQVPAHEPGPGCIVDVIHIPAAAEDIPRIEGAVLVQVQVVLSDEFLQVLGAQVCCLLPEGILQVKRVHGELIRSDDHLVVRDPPRHPVMPADRFQPPYLIHVVDGDSV